MYRITNFFLHLLLLFTISGSFAFIFSLLLSLTLSCSLFLSFSQSFVSSICYAVLYTVLVAYTSGFKKLSIPPYMHKCVLFSFHFFIFVFFVTFLFCSGTHRLCDLCVLYGFMVSSFFLIIRCLCVCVLFYYTFVSSNACMLLLSALRTV